MIVLIDDTKLYQREGEVLTQKRGWFT